MNVRAHHILIGVWEDEARGSVRNALDLAVAVGANEIFATEAGLPAVAPLALTLISDP